MTLTYRRAIGATVEWARLLTLRACMHLLPGHPLVLAADLVAAAMSRLAAGHRVRRTAVLTSMARSGHVCRIPQGKTSIESLRPIQKVREHQRPPQASVRQKVNSTIIDDTPEPGAVDPIPERPASRDPVPHPDPTRSDSAPQGRAPQVR